MNGNANLNANNLTPQNVVEWRKKLGEVPLKNVTASAETLPPNSQATVVVTDTPTSTNLAFGIPKGDKGEKGDTGPQGPKGDSGIIYQTTGQNTDGAMSQKATTDVLNGKVDWSAIKQSTGTSTIEVMSQKATTDELAKKINISDLLDKIYPVGSIYMSSHNVSPESFLGGTWLPIQDRFLISAGGKYSAGATGGESTHTLTIDEMPSHRHDENYGNVAWVDDNGAGSSVFGNLVTYNQTRTSKTNVTSSVGGGQPHNNIPPYYAVYMWERAE